ncbi:MAG: LamG domain-containing protein [Bacteroidia bacterium]|jgi:hypothetical protein|nr:LamG domain-containing protein [Bacteroidia bacterium]
MKALLISIGLALSCVFLHAQNYCMRFYGHGTGDIDRVKIALDAPQRPADIAFDFTIEFDLLAAASDNPLGSNAAQGNNDDWTLGHVIIDRDIFGNGDYGDFGISLAGSRIAAGVNNGSSSYTLIGNINVADQLWHHIAVTRNSATGQISLFVDGVADGSASGPAGNISYRDGRSTSWPNDPYLVIGAEKHDYDNAVYPSFNGHIDELRFSTVIRYTGTFTPPLLHTADSVTACLYHFDEGSGNVLLDASTAAGGPSPGDVRYGGSAPAGPVWVLRSATTSAPQSAISSVLVLCAGTNLHISGPDAQAAIELLDGSGRLLSSFVLPSGNGVIPANLPQGFYLVRYSGQVQKVIPVIIRH